MKTVAMLAACLLTVGAATAGCQSSLGTQDEAGASTTLEACAGESEACVSDCFDAHGVDVSDLESCIEPVKQCVEANPADPFSCLPVAEDCLRQAAGQSGDALVDCVESCGDQFGQCPDPATPADPLDGLGACLADHADCFTACGTGLAECDIPVVNCDAAEFEALADCIRAGGSLDEIRDCASTLSCDVGAFDMACYDAGRACFDACGQDVVDCLGN